MYSVGVIAVELFQPFGTEMERAHRLGELRHGTVPEALSQKWPILTKYIQLMTSRDPSVRPSATQLLESELFHTKDKVLYSDFLGSVKVERILKLVLKNSMVKQVKQRLQLQFFNCY